MNLPINPTTDDRPTFPGEWTIDQITDKLKRELPDSITETRKQGKSKLTYVPWYRVVVILDKYCPGWQWEVKSVQTSGNYLFLIGRLTIPTANGPITREATGYEKLEEERPIKITDAEGNESTLKNEWGMPVTQLEPLAYGDPSSNAESMALRRAASKFRLGLYLYDK